MDLTKDCTQLLDQGTSKDNSFFFFFTSAKLLGLLWPAGLCWLRRWLHEVYVCKPAGVVVAETVAARGVGLRL